MTILNLAKLPQANFRNIDFYYQDSTVDGGRKTVTHEFPDTDNRYVEDLGKLEKIFTINAIIDTNRNNSDRDSFIKVLEQEGVGVLIHPIYGRQDVVVKNFNINDNINELGIVRFNIVFERAARNRFPEQARSNLGFVDRLKKATTDALDKNFPNAWQSVKNNIEAFNNVNKATKDTAREIKRASQLIEGSADGVADFVSSINEVVNNSAALVQAPSDLASKLRTSFDNLEVAYNSSSDLYNVLKGMFGFNAASLDRATGSSTTTNAINTNQDQLNLFANISAISAAYNAAASINYSNLDALNTVRDELEAGFNTVDTTIDRSIYQELLELRVEANKVFDNLSINLARVVEYTTRPTNLTSLIYSQYGNLDNKQEIIDLNNIRDSSRVEGTIKILSNG
jgi:prophage DNA circulation protein